MIRFVFAVSEAGELVLRVLRVDEVGSVTALVVESGGGVCY